MLGECRASHVRLSPQALPARRVPPTRALSPCRLFPAPCGSSPRPDCCRSVMGCRVAAVPCVCWEIPSGSRADGGTAGKSKGTTTLQSTFTACACGCFASVPLRTVGSYMDCSDEPTLQEQQTEALQIEHGAAALPSGFSEPA